MNATATPAKVAPIKARVPLMQDENSGRDGRLFDEWLANRLDARTRARESADDIAHHPEPQDPPILTKTDKGVALMVWAVAPILCILVGFVGAQLFRN